MDTQKKMPHLIAVRKWEKPWGGLEVHSLQRNSNIDFTVLASVVQKALGLQEQFLCHLIYP